MDTFEEAELVPLGPQAPDSNPEQLIPGSPSPSSILNGLGTLLRELVETIILTLAIFLLIRFAVQNFRIEGTSMEPNLHDGQFLIVNKLTYMFHPPDRGDVIVFVPPTSSSRDFIKRVIGLPGDHVHIVDGRVFINDQPLQEPYPLHAAGYSFGEVTVPPGEYFVLGDNRNNSSDSHSWGTVSLVKIIGKAWVTYWPPQVMGLVPTYSYAAAP